MHNDLIIPSDNADTSNEKEYLSRLKLMVFINKNGL